MKATKKQKEYLWELGLHDPKVIDGLGKIQASKIIDAAKKKWGQIRRDDARKISGSSLVVLGVIILVVLLLLINAARR